MPCGEFSVQWPVLHFAFRVFARNETTPTIKDDVPHGHRNARTTRTHYIHNPDPPDVKNRDQARHEIKSTNVWEIRRQDRQDGLHLGQPQG